MGSVTWGKHLFFEAKTLDFVKKLTQLRWGHRVDGVPYIKQAFTNQDTTRRIDNVNNDNNIKLKLEKKLPCARLSDAV